MKKRLPRGFSFDATKQTYKLRFTFEGKRYSVYGRTQKECDDKKSEKLEQLKKRMHIDNQTITLKRYYESWRTEQEKDLKASTLYAYDKAWTHIAKFLGQRKMSTLCKADVQDMQKAMAGSSTPDTINRATRLLKQICNAAIIDRIIIYNPCAGIKQLRSDKAPATETVHRALTVQERKLFFEYTKDSFYYNLFQFLLKTGCRIGEALALTWFDISFAKQQIIISKTVSRTGNKEWTISSPKTESSRRPIPISAEIQTILEDQREKITMLFGSKQALVFPNSKGNVCAYNSVDRTIDHYVETISRAENMQFQRFSVHAFRHTCITDCYAQGMSQKAIMELVGHHTAAMSLHYTHVALDTVREELERIDFAV